MKTSYRDFFPIILLIAFILFGAATFLCHIALQNERIYRPLSGVIKTYNKNVDENGNKNLWLDKKPFAKITPERTIVWDADHYNRIRESVYDSDIDRWANYAFFPLFPLVWKVTGLNGLGICFFNWIVFSLGILFFFFFFRNKIDKWAFFLILLIPMNVIYMIPYTESLFFLCIACGLYGIIKDNYALYFFGFLFASMTKSSAAIFFAIFTCAEIVAYIRSRTWKQSLINYLKRLLPIIVGVLFVMIIQKLNGSPRWFFFIEAQKFWGKYLSLPTLPFSDWSQEGRSVTNPFLIMYFLPCVVVIIREFLLSFKRQTKLDFSTWEYAKYICLLYLAGNIFIAMLTQHGSLNSLARYMLCTPFFVFLLLDTLRCDREKMWQLLYIIIGIATTIICLSYFSQSNGIGIYFVMLGSLLVFFHRYFPKKLLYISIFIIIFANIFWTAYMFNCFICDAWIFT